MAEITIHNYTQYKPSEFVRSFISDVEVAEKSPQGKMDMMAFNSEEASNDCLPCLGGMACLNLGFEDRVMNNHFSESHPKYREQCIIDNVAQLGDSIRTGDSYEVEDTLKELYPDYDFSDVKFPNYEDDYDYGDSLGLIIKTPEQYQAVKNRIKDYVRVLEKAGL